MQENKEIGHYVITTIAISALFIASFMLSTSLFSQALAIHEGNTTTTTQNQVIGGNTTTAGTPSQDQTTTADTTTTQNQAATGGNATETGAATNQTQSQAPTAATQEPPMNQNFVRQGTVASGQDPLPGHESHEIAFVLPPRNDGGVYSGVLTYTASKPVEVVVLHNYDPQNSTDVPEAYGTELTSPLPDGSGNVAITLFQPPYEAGINSASVPFTGNALALHTLEDDPFTATYTVNAFATQPENANAPLEFTSAEGEVEEGAAGADEGADTTDEGADTTDTDTDTETETDTDTDTSTGTDTDTDTDTE